MKISAHTSNHALWSPRRYILEIFFWPVSVFIASLIGWIVIPRIVPFDFGLATGMVASGFSLLTVLTLNSLVYYYPFALTYAFFQYKKKRKTSRLILFFFLPVAFALALIITFYFRIPPASWSYKVLEFIQLRS